MDKREIIGHLTEARKLLRAGWMQEDYCGTQYNQKLVATKCYCAAGAIRQAVIGDTRGYRDTPEQNQKVNTIFQTLKTVGKLRGRKDDWTAEDAVICWNDAKRRTKQEVVDKFTAVINGLRAKKGPSKAK